MFRKILLYTALSAATLAPTAFATAAPPTGGSGIFGKKDGFKVVVVNGGPLRESKNFALGSFRVSFITSDEITSVHHGGMMSGGATAEMSGILTGLDHTEMQKITDMVYADFLAKATAQGLTMMDSVKLAAASPTYKTMGMTPNYEEGRLGTIVIPTGQTSVTLAEDHSKKATKGNKGLFTQYSQIGAINFATADANKMFPVAAKESGATVIGVTIVVNFADFKAHSGTFGGASTKVLTGATVDGQGMELLRETSIMGWGPKTQPCPACMAEVLFSNAIHSEERIGDVEVGKTRHSSSTMMTGETLASSASKAMYITVDVPAYEKNVLLVTAEASGLLLAELGTK
jgi:hypothetical protein